MNDPLQMALDAARAAGRDGEVPVGAAILGADGALLAQAGNRVEAGLDPTAHAEMLCIREACRRRGSKFLDGCDLYVTLEPCAMCAQAIAHARLRRVFFGAYDPKGGAIEHGPRLFAQPTCHHRPEVYGGLREAECGALLRDFFASRR